MEGDLVECWKELTQQVYYELEAEGWRFEETVNPWFNGTAMEVPSYRVVQKHIKLVRRPIPQATC